MPGAVAAEQALSEPHGLDRFRDPDEHPVPHGLDLLGPVLREVTATVSQNSDAASAACSSPCASVSAV
jgi:hypothetical protein